MPKSRIRVLDLQDKLSDFVYNDLIEFRTDRDGTAQLVIYAGATDENFNEGDKINVLTFEDDRIITGV